MRLLNWNLLSQSERDAALSRPAQRDPQATAAAAAAIIAAVRRGGDDALRDLTQRFDGVRLQDLAVSEAEFSQAEAALSAVQHAAIETAISTVRKFHGAQAAPPLRVETAPGVVCERISVPVRAVGLYVPAGSAPLPSTAIMLAVPAALAGCPVRIMCTPPRPDGAADPAVLVAARGNKWVSAVLVVAGSPGMTGAPALASRGAYRAGAGMVRLGVPGGDPGDLPAGVSEVLVIADDGAHAAFVAADLLAQAEHSPEAQALLVTTSRELAERVEEEVRGQAKSLARAAILAESVANIRLLVVDSLETAFGVANEYAPEHLLLEIRDARSWLGRVSAAGSVFLGDWSPESMGDYCSGTNHTLPTYGFARAYSGLSLDDFQKRITVQELTPSGLQGLAPTAQVLAGLEGLDAHAAAVAVRLRCLATGGAVAPGRLP